MANGTKAGIGGPEWTRLTAAQRVSLCYDYAWEAAQLAHGTRDLKAKYKAIATQWNTLAIEIEKAARQTR